MNFLKREGDDIYYNLPINFAQAALGTEVVVPTLDGDNKLRNSRRLQSGGNFPFQGERDHSFAGKRPVVTRLSRFL